MKNNNLWLFVSGLVTGASITYLYFRKKLRESEEVINDQNKKFDDINKILDEQFYNNSAKEYDTKQDEIPEDVVVSNDISETVLIPEDDFGEDPDYEQVTYIYYSDGFLVDDSEHPVDRIGTYSVSEIFEMLKQNEDSLYFVNTALEMYIEVLWSLNTYRELLEDKPYLVDENINLDDAYD